MGLVLGRQYGWLFMDPFMGLVATVVILSWSWTLIRSAAAVLIDVCPNPGLARRIASHIEQSVIEFPIYTSGALVPATLPLSFR